jgi:hypothetical protein
MMVGKSAQSVLSALIFFFSRFEEADGNHWNAIPPFIKSPVKGTIRRRALLLGLHPAGENIRPQNKRYPSGGYNSQTQRNSCEECRHLI